MPAGCSTTGSSDPSSINFRVPQGSKLVLDREVPIAAGYSHAKFHSGEQTPGVDQYTVNCSLEQRDLGPSTIVPDSFLISRDANQREWINQPHAQQISPQPIDKAARKIGIVGRSQPGGGRCPPGSSAAGRG